MNKEELMSLIEDWVYEARESGINMVDAAFFSDSTGEDEAERKVMEYIEDGSLKVEEFEGVRYIKVRAPLPGEEVVGYSSLSAFSHDNTPTEVASR